jgi:hypothetical protein
LTKKSELRIRTTEFVGLMIAQAEVITGCINFQIALSSPIAVCLTALTTALTKTVVVAKIARVKSWE